MDPFTQQAVTNRGWAIDLVSIGHHPCSKRIRKRWNIECHRYQLISTPVHASRLYSPRTSANGIFNSNINYQHIYDRLVGVLTLKPVILDSFMIIIHIPINYLASTHDKIISVHLLHSSDILYILPSCSNPQRPGVARLFLFGCLLSPFHWKGFAYIYFSRWKRTISLYFRLSLKNSISFPSISI